MTNEEIADELIKALTDGKTMIKSIHSAKDIIGIFPEVVMAVENISQRVKLSGIDKKELAVTVLNKLINIPYVPEGVEKSIFGWIIDIVVDTLNKYLWKVEK